MVNQLQRLIADRRSEKGWSYRDIARRGKMSRSTVYKLATDEYTGLPRAETLTQLAKGLGLPESAVREAALHSLRTKTTRSQTSQGRQILVGHAEELTEAQIAHVNRYIDMMFGKES